VSDAANPSASPALPVRRVDVERPWRWLAAGWRDFMAAPAVSLAYGALFVVGGLILTLTLWSLDWLYLALPLAAGFLLVAPVLATGLYEVSRQIEAGRRPSLADALGAWRARPGSLAVMGLVLMLFFLAWIRIAFLIFALFFASRRAGRCWSRPSSSAPRARRSSWSARRSARCSPPSPSPSRRYRSR
jgi:uncharacterized membrane protein